MPAHSQAAGMAVQGDNNVSKDPAVVNVLKSERQEEKDKWKRFQAAEKYWNFVNHQLVKMWTKARNNTMNQAEHKEFDHILQLDLAEYPGPKKSLNLRQSVCDP
ncbi:hypothetical protein SERLA73DRAFT_68064 [Serpula lacrymans var. lacrymans S7.3]|uniref:Uncharacterized protein n=1 Tax=Serpula lacrymans var. lacrymans (strain S7.3) TaxID=936435 RepID=F8PGM8_SERL3|nr:hypothetical protein SERLA73DRAFT_68064 [Serpula lacrymans var. lacrymans S7.3]